MNEREDMANRFNRLISEIQRGYAPTIGVRLWTNTWGWGIAAWWPTRPTYQVRGFVQAWRATPDDPLVKRVYRITGKTTRRIR